MSLFALYVVENDTIMLSTRMGSLQFKRLFALTLEYDHNQSLLKANPSVIYIQLYEYTVRDGVPQGAIMGSRAVCLSKPG